jgi:hypothetical protein
VSPHAAQLIALGSQERTRGSTGEPDVSTAVIRAEFGLALCPTHTYS